MVAEEVTTTSCKARKASRRCERSGPSVNGGAQASGSVETVRELQQAGVCHNLSYASEQTTL